MAGGGRGRPGLPGIGRPEPVANPRLTDDGARVAWTSWRDRAPEVHLADTDGGLATRLTYWGDHKTLTTGWTELSEVVAITATGQPSLRRTWARAIPTDGGPSRVLPYGPVSDLAFGPAGSLLLSAVMSREPAWWKRYRGGAAGKLWWDGSGGGAFVRLLTGLAGNIESPMLVGAGDTARIAFVSDHEGWGNVYSTAVPANGAEAGVGAGVGVAELRRHTDHGAAGSRLLRPSRQHGRHPGGLRERRRALAARLAGA